VCRRPLATVSAPLVLNGGSPVGNLAVWPRPRWASLAAPWPDRFCLPWFAGRRPGGTGPPLCLRCRSMQIEAWTSLGGVDGGLVQAAPGDCVVPLLRGNRSGFSPFVFWPATPELPPGQPLSYPGSLRTLNAWWNRTSPCPLFGALMNVFARVSIAIAPVCDRVASGRALARNSAYTGRPLSDQSARSPRCSVNRQFQGVAPYQARRQIGTGVPDQVGSARAEIGPLRRRCRGPICFVWCSEPPSRIKPRKGPTLPLAIRLRFGPPLRCRGRFRSRPYR